MNAHSAPCACHARSTLETAPPVVRAATEALDQCAAVLAALDDGVYARPSAVMFGASIGQHVRHALDHFEAALSALDGAAVNYDLRERGTPVETDAGVARRAVGAIRARLVTISSSDTQAPVVVRVLVDASGLECEHVSTLGRELAFAAHHAVHHYAMIAAIAREWSVPVPPGFGKAPSTIRHERSR